MMEVGIPSVGPIETNIDPRLQEKESTTRPIEELVEVQVDPREPSKVVKIGKCLSSKLAEQLVEFLKKNQNVFAWTHANMVRIHLDVMCHRLNIDPQAKSVHQKRRALYVEHYKALQEEVDHFLRIGFIRSPIIMTGYQIFCYSQSPIKSGGPTTISPI